MEVLPHEELGIWWRYWKAVGAPKNALQLGLRRQVQIRHWGAYPYLYSHVPPVRAGSENDESVSAEINKSGLPGVGLWDHEQR